MRSHRNPGKMNRVFEKATSAAPDSENLRPQANKASSKTSPKTTSVTSSKPAGKTQEAPEVKGASVNTSQRRIGEIRRALDEMKQYKRILTEDGLTPDEDDKRRESALIVELLRIEKALGLRPSVATFRPTHSRDGMRQAAPLPGSRHAKKNAATKKTKKKSQKTPGNSGAAPRQEARPRRGVY